MTGSFSRKVKSGRAQPKSLTKAMRAELDATGLPWATTVGGRHFHVRLDGHLALILPLSPKRDQVQEQNNIRTIRRKAAAIKAGDVSTR